MYLIIGLGNPGKKYQNNKHNVGFKVLDKLSKDHKIKLNKTKFNSIYGKGSICSEEVILIQPQTFMNLSGEAVIKFLKWHKLNPENLIVIYDDMDLPLGKIRIRLSGRSGGHNGIKSILENIKTQDFPRIRIGIDKPPEKMSPEKYVLTNFNKQEREIINSSISDACEAILKSLKYGFHKAMNEFN